MCHTLDRQCREFIGYGSSGINANFSIHFVGHTGEVSSVVFNSDGKKIVTSDYDETVKIWDTDTQKEIKTFTRDNGINIHNIALSPNGNLIAADSYDYITTIWDIQRGELDYEFSFRRSNKVTGLQFLPDNRTIAIGDTSIKIWDIYSGQFLYSYDSLFMYDCSLIDFKLNKDATKYISVCSSDLENYTSKDYILVWDVKTGTMIKKFYVGKEIMSMSLNPDGNTIAITRYGADPSVELWSIEKSEKIMNLPLSGVGDGKVAFSPDGKMVAGLGDDGTTDIWDITTGKRIKSIATQYHGVNALAFSPDGRRILTGGTDKIVKLWDLN